MKLTKEVKTFLDYDEHTIEEEISKEDGSSIHGILVFNIDNFSQVNETFGYEVGDEIIKLINENTLRLFRGSDIIVQLNGGEFMVYNRNIGEINNAETLAENLLKSISAICINDTFRLTVSVGIAIYPLHGKDYQELKTKAYQAMYSAKANGKNGFRIYDSARTKKRFNEFKYGNGNNETFSLNPLDKNFKELAIQILYEDRDTVSAINTILELMCIYMGFSRAFIYTQKELDTYEEKKLRYCISGFETGKETETLKYIQGDLACRLYDISKDIVLIHCNDKTIDSNIKKYLDDQKARDILFFPVIQAGNYEAAVIFENMTDNIIDFDHNALQKLKSQMKIIQSYIFNISSKGKNKEYISKLELFDNIDAYTYIIDYDTYDIDFINRKALFSNETNKLGEKCYRIFQNREEPCDDCPMRRMNKQNPHDSSSGDMFNYSVRKWTKNLYSWMDTREHNSKCILISVNINDFFEE